MAVDWNAHVHGTCDDQVLYYLVLEVLGLVQNVAISNAVYLEFRHYIDTKDVNGDHVLNWRL